MRSMSDTIARLNAASARLSAGAPSPAGPARLQPLTGFGSNPGALTGWSYVPDAQGALPLVVVLHGCTQNAAGYDHGSGWSTLAERYGFAVLFPEQSRSNNPNLCFNWFASEDTTRDRGEVASIRQMIATMTETYPIDSTRVFVTGLSAGGAMTSAMLATYPEVFTGGAIIAGLPHGSAKSVPEAFDRMRGHGHVSDATSAAAIGAASRHPGPWPTISVWQGDADATVSAVNADRIVGQWRIVQGLPEAPDVEDSVDGQRHRAWTRPDGKIAIETYTIAGMGHGTPLATSGTTAAGTAMPFMLDVGISSTWHIARSWGLLPDEARVAPSDAAQRDAPTRVPELIQTTPTTRAASIQDTIEAALRSAGLMR